MALSDGTLIIKQTVLDMWIEKHATFSTECSELLKHHNDEFNPKNLKRGIEDTNENKERQELPNKQFCAQGTLSKADFEKQYPDRLRSWLKPPTYIFINTAEAILNKELSVYF